jgi:hypothetical protein
MEKVKDFQISKSVSADILVKLMLKNLGFYAKWTEQKCNGRILRHNSKYKSRVSTSGPKRICTLVSLSHNFSPLHLLHLKLKILVLRFRFLTFPAATYPNIIGENVLLVIVNRSLEK